MPLDVTYVHLERSCLNGVSNKSRSVVIRKTNPKTLGRTGMLRATGMNDVRLLSSLRLPLLRAPTVPAGNAKFYRSPFLRDFWHLNVAMMTSNNALIPDPDKEDVLASKPLDWPFMHLGLRMCGWADTQLKYYLIGTPAVYWTGAVSLIVGLITLGVYLMRMQRKYVDMEPRELLSSILNDRRLNLCQMNGITSFMLARSRSMAGVSTTVCFPPFMAINDLADVNLVPFLIMGRVTYVHHYVCLSSRLYPLNSLRDCTASNPLLRHSDGCTRIRSLRLFL
jgi:hypothetical protein